MTKKKRRLELVTRVIDGNTFLTKSRKGLVVLANVDAPAPRAPYSIIARNYLAKLIQGKKVHIRPIKRDAYGRSIVLVHIGKRSVNQLMMRKW